MNLPDVQNQEDGRGISIDRVGVSDVEWPVRIKRKDGKSSRGIASFNLSVDLPHNLKGTHMSRFIQELRVSEENPLSIEGQMLMAASLMDRLDAESASILSTFPFPIERAGPASGLLAPVVYRAGFKVEVHRSPALKMSGFVLVKAPITTLCPCSKEISEYGAHNQRGVVDLAVEQSNDLFMWIEDLVDLIEGAASAPVRTLVKRADERSLTMQAFNHPRFVEDVVREIVKSLRELGANHRQREFSVCCLNAESIHPHNAFAQVVGKIGRADASP